MTQTPDWAQWRPHELGAYTVGIEEEVMLLDPATWSLAHRIESVLPRIPPDVADQTTAETHGSALELQTRVHREAGAAAEEMAELRGSLEATLRPLHLRAACAGTHPFAVWQEIAISAGERYQFVYGSMRELARREPTFALHVHVGIPTPRPRSGSPTVCALTCRCCWRSRPTRPFGRDATPGWPRRGRRSSRPSRGSACRSSSTPTSSTSRQLTC